MSKRLISAGALLIALGLLSWWSGADRALHPLLRLSPGSPWRAVAWSLSLIGSLAVMGPIALLAAIVVALRGQRRAALWLAATVTGGRLLSEGLKLLILRPRPPIADRLELVTSWSFPSSHSAGTMLTALALAILIGRPAALWTALIIAGAVGWSRLALGVHWPGDVLAGWGFGLVCAGTARYFHKRMAVMERGSGK